MAVVVLLYNRFYGADHWVIRAGPWPDWTPSSFMFVISGPAPVVLDLDGGHVDRRRPSFYGRGWGTH